MRMDGDVNAPDPTPEEVDRALEAFRNGRPEELDRLVGDGRVDGWGIGQLLALCVKSGFDGLPPRVAHAGSESIEGLVVTPTRAQAER